ncbi:MAG: hypothetical protein IMW97_04580 [Firmicutes bacterium]|nr:hypothetical protein [Candidatus Fermentithermobacillaceae bacterium]
MRMPLFTRVMTAFCMVPVVAMVPVMPVTEVFVALLAAGNVSTPPPVAAASRDATMSPSVVVG